MAGLKEQNKHNQYQSALKAVPHPLSPTDLVCFSWDRACCASKGARAFIDVAAGAIRGWGQILNQLRHMISARLPSGSLHNGPPLAGPSWLPPPGPRDSAVLGL